MKPDTHSESAVSSPTIYSMKFKSQLRLYLAETGLTAAALAKKSGVPKQSLSGWLSGSNPRDIRQVKRVADTLGITVDHLLFGEGLLGLPAPKGLNELIGDEWFGGAFELKIRRIRK